MAVGGDTGETQLSIPKANNTSVIQYDDRDGRLLSVLSCRRLPVYVHLVRRPSCQTCIDSTVASTSTVDHCHFWRVSDVREGDRDRHRVSDVSSLETTQLLFTVYVHPTHPTSSLYWRRSEKKLIRIHRAADDCLHPLRQPSLRDRAV